MFRKIYPDNSVRWFTITGGFEILPWIMCAADRYQIVSTFEYLAHFLGDINAFFLIKVP